LVDLFELHDDARTYKFMCFSLYSYLQPIYYYRQSRSEADVFCLIPASLTPSPPPQLV